MQEETVWDTEATRVSKYYRAPSAGSSDSKVKVYHLRPAPGQFIAQISGQTEEEACRYAETRMNVQNNYVSLGAWGGYIIVGFDHSVYNKPDVSSNGGYDFAIIGNPFDGSSEPGIVYVMQDENGDGLPNDTWYELRGSETGKAETYQHYVRVILNLIDLNQSLIRNAKVSKLCCSCDNIYHTAALYCNLASETISCVNDLLYAVYIGCKSGNNDSVCLIFIEKIIKHMSHRTFRHGKSGSLCISTVTHQCQYSLSSNLCKTLQINGISEYRSIIYFKVAGMHYDACRRIDCKCRCILGLSSSHAEF